GLERLGHRYDHAAVLERPCRVQALVLEVEVRQSQRTTDVAAGHERRRAFVQVDVGRVRTDGQKLVIPGDDPHLRYSLIRRREGTLTPSARAAGPRCARALSAVASPRWGAW